MLFDFTMDSKLPKPKEDESTKKGGDPFSEYEDTLDTFVSVDDSFNTYASVFKRPDTCGAPGTVICDERNAETIEPSYEYVHMLGAPRDTLFNPSMSICTKYEHCVYNNPKTTKKIDTSHVQAPVHRVMWLPKRGMLLSIVGHGDALVWNRTNFRYEVLGTLLKGDQETINSLALSKQEDFILVANKKGALGCYDIFRDYQRELWRTAAEEQAKTSAVTDITLSPTNVKFVDSRANNVAYVRDLRRPEVPEHSFQTNGEVRSCDWNPVSSLVALGGCGFVTLADPRTKKELHRWGFDAVKVRWNLNAQWLLAPLKDNSIVLFDIRRMGTELCKFTGTDDISAVAWHPVQERVFVSGTNTKKDVPSAMHFWLAGASDSPIGSIKNVHSGKINDIAWHPSGHVLATAGNDSYIKFFTRNKPGTLRTDADMELRAAPNMGKRQQQQQQDAPLRHDRGGGGGFGSHQFRSYYQGQPSFDKYRMPMGPPPPPSSY